MRMHHPRQKHDPSQPLSSVIGQSPTIVPVHREHRRRETIRAQLRLGQSEQQEKVLSAKLQVRVCEGEGGGSVLDREMYSISCMAVRRGGRELLCYLFARFVCGFIMLFV